MTKPGFITIGKRKIRAFLDDNGQPIEVYDEDAKAYVIYGKLEKSNLEVLYTVEKETRFICGKTRTCKISNGKIVEVYDDEKKVYLPHDLFLKRQEEYKTNPIIDDTIEKKKEEIEKKDEKKDEKKEYYTTHGKKTKEIKDPEEDKKVKGDNKQDIQNLPSNTTTTTISTSGTSGTLGLDILVPDIQINANVEKKKDYEFKEKDPYNWYIKSVLRRDIGDR